MVKTAGALANGAVNCRLCGEQCCELRTCRMSLVQPEILCSSSSGDGGGGGGSSSTISFSKNSKPCMNLTNWRSAGSTT